MSTWDKVYWYEKEIILVSEIELEQLKAKHKNCKEDIAQLGRTAVVMRNADKTTMHYQKNNCAD